MNLRTLKKHCKRAMAVLISEHGFAADAFQCAEGEEAIYAPTTMERRFTSHGFLAPGPLKGTWLLWQKSSYEYDEWDCDLPSEVLRDILFWQNFVPTQEDLAA